MSAVKRSRRTTASGISVLGQKNLNNNTIGNEGDIETMRNGISIYINFVFTCYPIVSDGFYQKI